MERIVWAIEDGSEACTTDSLRNPVIRSSTSVETEGGFIDGARIRKLKSGSTVIAGWFTFKPGYQAIPRT